MSAADRNLIDELADLDEQVRAAARAHLDGDPAGTLDELDAVWIVARDLVAHERTSRRREVSANRRATDLRRALETK